MSPETRPEKPSKTWYDNSATHWRHPCASAVKACFHATDEEYKAVEERLRRLMDEDKIHEFSSLKSYFSKVAVDRVICRIEIPDIWRRNAGEHKDFLLRQMVKAIRAVERKRIRKDNKKKTPGSDAPCSTPPQGGTKTQEESTALKAQPGYGPVELFGERVIWVKKNGKWQDYTTIAEVCSTEGKLLLAELQHTDVSWDKFQRVMSRWDDDGKHVSYNTGANGRRTVIDEQAFEAAILLMTRDGGEPCFHLEA